MCPGSDTLGTLGVSVISPYRYAPQPCNKTFFHAVLKNCTAPKHGSVQPHYFATCSLQARSDSAHTDQHDSLGSLACEVLIVSRLEASASCRFHLLSGTAPGKRVVVPACSRGWVNYILETTWPHFRTAASALVKNIDPLPQIQVSELSKSIGGSSSVPDTSFTVIVLLSSYRGQCAFRSRWLLK